MTKTVVYFIGIVALLTLFTLGLIYKMEYVTVGMYALATALVLFLCWQCAKALSQE